MRLFFFHLAIIFIFINPVMAIERTSFGNDTIVNHSIQNIFKIESITAGILFSHFTPKNYSDGIENNTAFINPGIEILIHFSLCKTINFTSGLNYQHCKIMHGQKSLDIKTMTDEISVPLLLTLNPIPHTVQDVELTAGFYLGQYVRISNNVTLFENNDDNYAELFSSDDFISDIFIGIGKKSIIKSMPIGFDLFFRYRLKQHLSVNHEVYRSLYGIKLKYEFNL